MAIGKSISMLDARARVRGEVPYAINLKLPGMLVAKVLRSPVPHGRLTKLDTRVAERLSGVAAILTADDFDRPGGPDLITGAMVKDQPVVAGKRLRYLGEPVALVAAEHEAVAERAIELIEMDYEELPGVFDALEAMQPGVPVLHENYPDNQFVYAKIRHGDLDAGFAAADEIVEETYTSPIAQQTSLEPHVTAAQWRHGRLTVWTAAQAPHLVRRVLAEIFGLDLTDVRVIVPPLGGGYGGKGHVRIEPMMAALAVKTGGRPVKLTLTRAEEFVTVTKHAATIRIKTGVKRDGTLTARLVTMYWNGGAYADASPALVRAAMVRSLGPYRLPAAWVDTYGIYTNLPPAAAFRGAMSSQTTWAYESHMDTLADRLGLDPLQFRLQNVLRDGDEFATGERMHDIHFADCLQAVADGLGWGSKSAETPRTVLRRGCGLAVMIKSTPATSKSQCRLVMDAEGRVTLYTSTVEMGQGAHTALAQITAGALGLSLEVITVTGPDTDVTPFDTTTSASRSTNMMGNAILAGAHELEKELSKAAVPIFELPAEQLIAKEGFVYSHVDPEKRISYPDVLRRNKLEFLEARGEISTSGGLDFETGQGIGSLHYHQGSGACEVEVNSDTGKVTVLRYYASSFAGKLVNPRLAQLQNDGNVVYGMGPALMEEVVINSGQVVNANLSEYQIPAFLDIPEQMASYTLEAEGSDFHGIGEMTLPPVAPAIANAIFNAVGVRIYDLPITPEKILRAIRNVQD